MISIITSPRCVEYGMPGHPERPERISKTVDFLRSRKDFGMLEWREPQPAAREDLLRVHPASHLQTVESGSFADMDTPAYPGIFEHAVLSAGAAVLSARLAAEGLHPFSLMRPPGHHCTRDRLMGFCYLNNIAIGIEAFRAARPGARAAIFDFDCHHGNGTEAIYEGDPNTLFISLHQSPCYPGTGDRSRGNIRNFPLPPRTKPADFMKTCRAALDEIRAFQPDVLAISAGFDAYRKDPITEMSLEIDTFHEIGAELSKIRAPSLALLEGGYADELPLCIGAFLEGWDREPARPANP